MTRVDLKVSMGLVMFAIFVGVVARDAGVAHAASKCSRLFSEKEKSVAQKGRVGEARAAFIDFAEREGWDGYTFEDLRGKRLPVVAAKKDGIEDFVEAFGDRTISFISRVEPPLWHAYIRVGRLLIDLQVSSFNRRQQRDTIFGNVREYAKVMRTSKKSSWKEAVIEVEPEDLSDLTWFYLYRKAAMELEFEVPGSGVPWYRVFKEMGKIDHETQENCTAFVLSPFFPELYSDLPSVAVQVEMRKRTAKFAREFDVPGAPPKIEALLGRLEKISKRYGFKRVPAPTGLMRLAHLSPKTVGYIVHNFKKGDFRRENRMDFEARANDGSDLAQGFDVRVGEREEF